MHELINEHGWVWVFVQDPGRDERYVGQHYAEEDISFIPAFVDKEEALKCHGRMVLEKNTKYEAQAVHYEDLIKEAAKNGFVVFLLNGNGEILDKIMP
ncbi:hypothetical protein [Desulfococcus sp.]|uniref:hypothetical protein n=1 Tax=Desulfococcus sp. TaxID=2025834 RepID=UPI00359395D7